MASGKRHNEFNKRINTIQIELKKRLKKVMRDKPTTGEEFVSALTYLKSPIKYSSTIAFCSSDFMENPLYNRAVSKSFRELVKSIQQKTNIKEKLNDRLKNFFSTYRTISPENIQEATQYLLAPLSIGSLEITWENLINNRDLIPSNYILTVQNINTCFINQKLVELEKRLKVIPRDYQPSLENINIYLKKLKAPLPEPPLALKTAASI